jgi:hypothetical protein
MYGLTVNMYVNTVAGGNSPAQADIITGWQSSQYVQDIPLMYPDCAPSSPPSGYLFQKSNGDFNAAFANELSSFAPYWQQIMTLFYRVGTYSGKVNIDQCLNLFPVKIEFPEEYNVVYLTTPELDEILCVYKNNATLLANWFEKNGNIFLGNCPLNHMSFNDRYIYYSLWYMANPDTYSMYIYNTAGYATTVMQDGMYFYSDTAGSYYHTMRASFVNKLRPEYTPPELPDPFEPGGSSGPGGGTGTFDRDGDAIPFPSKPAISVTDCGFLTLFATNQAGIKDLADYLWSDLFSAITPGGSMEETITTLKKIVSNPYDAILGCSIVPVTPPTAGRRDVKLYGVLNSGVQLPVVTDQWVMKDCGTLKIDEYWGSYLDYAPYTKVTSLYLPYVGVVSIDTDLIMGKSLQVKYWIDVLSGQCMAGILINGVLEFQYQGHCSTPIPVTSIDFSSTIQSGLSLVGSVANIAGTAVGALGMSAGAGLAAVGGAALTKLPSVASDVMNSKPDIKSGSGIGGSGGLMSCQTPFLILEWPRQSLPSVRDADNNLVTQKHWTGYPSNVAAKLGNVNGYVEVTRVNISKMTATETEKQEIEQLLSGGVYIE